MELEKRSEFIKEIGVCCDDIMYWATATLTQVNLLNLQSSVECIRKLFEKVLDDESNKSSMRSEEEIREKRTELLGVRSELVKNSALGISDEAFVFALNWVLKDVDVITNGHIEYKMVEV